MRHPKRASPPLRLLRQRPVCSLRGRLLRLWKAGNGPGFPQAEPSTRRPIPQGSKSGGSRSKLAEVDVVKLLLAEQLHGQAQQAVDDVSDGVTNGVSACPSADIQIMELGIDTDRLQGRDMQCNP